MFVGSCASLIHQASPKPRPRTSTDHPAPRLHRLRRLAAKTGVELLHAPGVGRYHDHQVLAVRHSRVRGTLARTAPPSPANVRWFWSLLHVRRRPDGGMGGRMWKGFSRLERSQIGSPRFWDAMKPSEKSEPGCSDALEARTVPN